MLFSEAISINEIEIEYKKLVHIKNDALKVLGNALQREKAVVAAAGEFAEAAAECVAAVAAERLEAELIEAAKQAKQHYHHC